LIGCYETPRADSRPSLQVRCGSASKARADIHIAEELSFFLHSRKAAWMKVFRCGPLREFSARD
jgi:hypothetical protein